LVDPFTKSWVARQPLKAGHNVTIEAALVLKGGHEPAQMNRDGCAFGLR
jgi:hypothetical protein